MPQKTETPTTEAGRHISKPATLALWVRSGGRCARCNKYLLEEPYTERLLNLGERAHVAGWSDEPGSPRGDSDVPLSERGNVENLMLLCLECHKVVDDPAMRADFPEELLLEMKRDHEERIFHLTAMAKDRETAVLRVFGSVRGSVPEMARELALRTVVDGAGRYAKFPLAINKHDIEIDLSRLPEPTAPDEDAYWKMGRAQIDSVMPRIADGIRDKHVRHLSIFALARIPLLIYLGYALDDKVPIDLYQKHRGENEGWIWPEEEATALFEIVRLREGEPSAAAPDVAVVLSLSGTILLTDLPETLNGLTVFEIRPVGVTPNPNLFRSRATLDAFVRKWHDLLAELERTHKQAKQLHLFPAISITAAVACGRAVMRDVHPALNVYDRIGGDFHPALTINEAR